MHLLFSPQMTHTVTAGPGQSQQLVLGIRACGPSSVSYVKHREKGWKQSGWDQGRFSDMGCRLSELQCNPLHNTAPSARDIYSLNSAVVRDFFFFQDLSTSYLK